MRRSIVTFVLAAGLALLSAQVLFAASPARASAGVVPAFASASNDFGRAGPNLPLKHITLLLKRSPQKQALLKQFLADQQNPLSPDYHHWLTPDEFGARFGPSRHDLRVARRWLESQGFTVEGVAKGRMWMTFSGTVTDVERAFHTEIHNYLVRKKLYYANATAPSMPSELAGVTAGVLSLNNYPLKAMHTPPVPVPAGAPVSGSPGTPQPDFTTSGGVHYVAPGDFATIFDVKSLYDRNPAIVGAGVTIAIVGRTNPAGLLNAVADFQLAFWLPIHAPTITINPATGNPGDVGANEDTEAELDVEWSGGVAPYATIDFVTSKSGATDGVTLSAQYIVDNDLAPVMSTSFGLCEQYLGSSQNTFYNDLWSQAAAEGITAFVSSGDSGADSCENDSLSVNGLASTPYDVCVGGTEFNEGSGTYWSSANFSNNSSALKYIPEMAWNESGGGVSGIYSKPSWQVSPGVPADGMRDVPDVSLPAAASHDAALIYLDVPGITPGFSAIGGTSWSSPSWAGVMALVVQSTGRRQGNANIRFYQLGNEQYTNGTPVVFHDTTTGNNSVPGVTGYSCTTAYDQATGLGTPDVTALVDNWPPCSALSVMPSSPLPDGTVGSPYTVTFSTVGGTGPYTYAVTLGSVPAGMTLSRSGVLSGTPTKPGYHIFTVTSRDAAFCGGSRTYQLYIACQTITVGPASIPDGIAGVAYTSTTFTETNGTGATTLSESGALPTGMSFSAGTLSGTPTVTGSFPITVTATDTNGCKGTKNYTLTIKCPTITVSPATIPQGVAGVAYTSTTLTETNGIGAITWSESGALPTGMSFSAAGTLSGTPVVAGAFPITVTATDVNGCQGTRNYTLKVVCPILTLNPASPLPDATAGVPYSQTFSVSGGTGSYTYGETGTLPAGLTLSGDTLSGTPTQTGLFSITVTAVDTYGCSTSRLYSLTVVCPTINIAPATLPAGVKGQSYSVTLTPSAGIQPFTYSLLSGNLPAGLTLASGGTISGTYSGTGSHTFTVEVTDKNGCTGQRTYTVSVYSLALFDDGGTAAVCLDSTTGAFQWTVLSGPNAGKVYTGTLEVYDGGTMYWSQPGASQYVYVYYDPNDHAAWGYVYDYTTGVYSGIYDSTTLNNPAGCGKLPPP